MNRDRRDKPGDDDGENPGSRRYRHSTFFTS